MRIGFDNISLLLLLLVIDWGLSFRENYRKVYLHRLYSGTSNKDISSTLLLAECAMLCNANPTEIIKKLTSRNRINLKVETREVEVVAARYFILDFIEIPLCKDKDNVYKRVIAVRGSTSLKNLQDSTDMPFEFDSVLNINLHRGFKRVYTSIFNNIPDYAFEKYTKDGKEIEFSFTGHSLGGVMSCLLGAAFYNKVIEV